MTLLGLDVGEKRIGVARTDEANLMAHRVGFIERKNDDYALEQLKKLTEEFRVTKIVVGLPRTLKGEIGPQAQKVLSFIDYLKARLRYPIITWDERFTTAEAERILIEQDFSRRKRRIKRDAIAAELMLQSYLEFLGRKGGSGEDV